MGETLGWCVANDGSFDVRQEFEVARAENAVGIAFLLAVVNNALTFGGADVEGYQVQSFRAFGSRQLVNEIYCAERRDHYILFSIAGAETTIDEPRRTGESGDDHADVIILMIGNARHTPRGEAIVESERRLAELFSGNAKQVTEDG